MPGFTDTESRIIKKFISDHKLSSSLALIRGAMESIWANDAPRIVQNYTDHGEEHSIRVAAFVEKLLKVNPNVQFSEQEIYLLLAGVYLHDIGMQCDVVKYPGIKTTAEKLGAKFDVEFPEEATVCYLPEQQNEIRKNHHYLSAAWIDYLYREKNNVLSPAFKSIPDDLVEDLMDVCKFHSKLSIKDCDVFFKFDRSCRKKMVAALLRFADELDISSKRVNIETAKIFNLNPGNSVYWWLHNYTKVSFISSNKIHFNIRLHPDDFELYGSFVFDEYIFNFRKKNQPVLDILVEYTISIVVDTNSDVVISNYAEKLPPEITAILDKNMKENLHSLYELSQEFQLTVNQTRLKEAKIKYFEYLANECGEITLEGLPADNEVGSRRLRLESIFVPVDLEEKPSLNLETSYLEKTGKSEFKPSERQKVGNVFSVNRQLAILAPPGGGKTTFLKRLAIAYAFPDRRVIIDDNLPDEDLFPLFIRCRQLGELANSTLSDILRTIPKKFERDDLEKEFLYTANISLQNGKALLLIDGIDEITSEGYRVSFVKELRKFLSIYRNIRLVVTSREAGFRLISGSLSSFCRVYRIADLTDNDIKRLTLAWNREVIGNKPEVLFDSEKLAKDICDSDRVHRLAKNPLLLTTLLLVNRWVGQLPTKRSVLYGKAIEVLLMTWNVEGYKSIDLDEAIPQLSFVAFSMMRDEVQRISLRRLKELLNQAREQMPDVLKYAKLGVTEFINRVELRSSLLVFSGYEIEQGTLYSMYEFQHLTFQEYLAANAVVEGYYPERKDNDSILQVLQPYLENQQWKEVIPLAAVLAGRRTNSLIEYLVNECKKYPVDLVSTYGSESESSTRLVMPQVLLAHCILDEVKIAPDLLRDSFEVISRRADLAGDVIADLSMGKFGEDWKGVILSTYFNSCNKLFGLLASLTVILVKENKYFYEKFGESSELKSIIEYLEDTNKLLSSVEAEKKLYGIVYAIAFFTKPKKLSEESQLFLKDSNYLRKIDDGLLPFIYSDDVHLLYPALLALLVIMETRQVNFQNSSEITQRLLEIWMESDQDLQIMASSLISTFPLMNRDTCSLPKPNIQSMNFLKDQFYSKLLGVEEFDLARKLACLIVGFYWKTPWNDEEIVQLISEIMFDIIENSPLKDQLKSNIIVHLLDSLGESGKIVLESLREKEYLNCA